MTVEKQQYEAIQEPVLSNLPQVIVAASNDSIYGEETVKMKDFVIGAFVGGIIGAAAGLLLAPKAGKELRGEVAVQAVNIKDKSVELSSTAKEKTVQLSHQIKEQSTQLVDKVKSKTSKAPTLFDDGTVSSEGEEPLEEAIAVIEELVAAGVKSADSSLDDTSEATRPSTI
ncbi:YtxH domain-containing protein [Lysinibacillus sp. 54212]|uniref:YtxH domain-containing protein n=1 Tax=Lysinibacillus sp. 54212 TaxID=3119829 RepID=UPI002FCCA10D